MTLIGKAEPGEWTMEIRLHLAERTIVSTVDYDVVVVGAGNAGLVAALTAHEAGARVVVLEAASFDERGGNSRFSGSIFRAVHDGLDSIKPILAEPGDSGMDKVTVGPYPRQRYIDEWLSTSQGLPPRQLVETVVDRSFETLEWMRDHGVEWELTLSKLFDPGKLDRVYDLPPGGAIRVRDEGVGLMAALFKAVEDAGIDVWYDSPAADLLDGGLDGRRGAGPPGAAVRRGARCGGAGVRRI